MEPGDVEDLPVISGIQTKFAKKYPVLSQMYLNNSLEFLRALKKIDFYKRYEVSEIHFDPVFGFTVFTRKDRFEVFYGKDNIADKHIKLKRFVNSSRFTAKKIVRLDLDSKDRIIIRQL